MSFPLPIPQRTPSVTIGQNDSYAYVELSGLLVHQVAALESELKMYGYVVKDFQSLSTPRSYTFSVTPSALGDKMPKEFSEAFKNLVYKVYHT